MVGDSYTGILHAAFDSGSKRVSGAFGNRFPAGGPGAGVVTAPGHIRPSTMADSGRSVSP